MSKNYCIPTHDIYAQIVYCSIVIGKQSIILQVFFLFHGQKCIPDIKYLAKISALKGLMKKKLNEIIKTFIIRRVVFWNRDSYIFKYFPIFQMRITQ